MIPTSVIALFCDDIREEKSGAFTLVGVLGDNVSLPRIVETGEESKTLAPVIPKLSIYARINFDASANVDLIRIRVTGPSGSELHNETIPAATIAEAQGSSQHGNPIAGIIWRFQFAVIQVRRPGRITVEVTFGTQVYIGGVLNFVLEDAPTTLPTALPQPF